MKFKHIIPVIVGAILGYAYYYFIGCRNGCPIQSNPLTSILYGALLGTIISLPSNPSKNKNRK